MNALEVFAILVIIAVMWAAFRDPLINWGQSQPVLSTVVVMIAAGVAWLMFVRWTPKPKNDTPHAVSQSATASGSSIINQAGGNQTIIINQGVSEEAVRRQINATPVDVLAKLGAKYPHGYVIFGVANGKIVQESKLVDMEIDADWDAVDVQIDASKNRVAMKIPRLDIIDFPRGPNDPRHATYTNNREGFDFIENTPHRSRLVEGMYYEVFDAAKKIFLIGFK